MAFKQKIMEEIRDGKWKSAYQAATMYGIKDALVYKWMHCYPAYGIAMYPLIEVLSLFQDLTLSGARGCFAQKRLVVI